MSQTTTYIHEDFLLNSSLSRRLFHDVAKPLPIVDVHNHLPPAQIAEDTQPNNLATLWVIADQYKHRAMRINGVAERGITGEADDYEKYTHWAKTLPKTLGNPLYAWSYLELQRVFDCHLLLNEHSAQEVWEQCNQRIEQGRVTPVSLLKQFGVEALCTSDDLLDDVSVHQQASASGIAVRPSLRTDTILELSDSFVAWCQRLEAMTDNPISDLDSYEAAIRQRFADFDAAGCRLADQALDAGFDFQKTDRATASTLFEKRLAGTSLSASEVTALKSYLLVMVGKACAHHGWALQLHIGAQRQTSTRLKNTPGIWGGFAAIGQVTDIATLVSVLDTMDQAAALPRIVLYNLNPADNAAFASLAGSFSEDGVAGKIQLGSAWWYNDHYDGIASQLSAFANHGLLHHAIGMTTDSRSFLSMLRHEYFRRVLCEWLAQGVHKGLFPQDETLLGELVTAVCYTNAKDWILTKNV